MRSSVRQCDASGALDFPVAIEPSMCASTRIDQFWFRDAQHPDGTTVGLSNAVSVTFCR